MVWKENCCFLAVVATACNNISLYPNRP